MPIRSSNPNRVSPPVLVGIGIGAALLAAVAVVLDLNVSKQDIGAWSDILLFILGIVGAGGGAAWGAQRASTVVTPILTAKGDVPRDLEGRRLEPVSHDPAGGYPHSPYE